MLQYHPGNLILLASFRVMESVYPRATDEKRQKCSLLFPYTHAYYPYAFVIYITYCPWLCILNASFQMGPSEFS